MKIQTPIEARKFILEKLETKEILQKDLAQETEIPATTVSMVLSGRRKPSTFFLERCADYLGLDLDALIKSQREYEVWSKTEEGKRSLVRESQFDPPHRRTLGTLANWQIRTHMDLGELEIDPSDKVIVQFASVDFTRGTFRKPNERTNLNSVNEPLLLKASESVVVYSQETIKLPSFIVGHVGGISFHIKSGVAVSFGLQLDPFWKGQPFALFTNHGSDDFHLEPREHCLSIEFSYLSAEPEPKRSKD